MSRTRTIIHGITLLIAGAIALAVMLRSPEFAHGQPLGAGMDRSGTATCGFAHERRGELRAALAEGLSIEAIQAAYAERFGAAALSVPPNKGSQRLLYLFPLAAIALGAGLVIVTLRRWKRRSDEASAAGEKRPPKGVAAGARDDYDDKLDEELKNLDREDGEDPKARKDREDRE